MRNGVKACKKKTMTRYMYAYVEYMKFDEIKYFVSCLIDSIEMLVYGNNE